MKRLATLTLLGLALAFVSCSSAPESPEAASAEEAPRLKTAVTPPGLKKIAVLDFKNVAPHGGTDLERFARDRVEKWMELNGTFAYVSEPQLEAKEPLRDEKGELKMDAVLDAAKDQGVAAVLIGSIEEMGLEESGDDTGFFRTRTLVTRGRIKVRVFDVTTRKEIFTRSEYGRFSTDSTRLLAADAPAVYSHDAGKAAVTEALDRILEELPKYARRIDWSGKVAKVDAPRIYLDAGRLSGLRKGQVLKVYGPLEGVTDAESAKELGKARGRLKGTIRVVDFFGEDGAIALLHSGSGVQEKDRVELYLPRQP